MFDSLAVLPSAGLIACYQLNNSAEDCSTNGHNGKIKDAVAARDRFDNSQGAMNFNGIDAWIRLDTLIDNQLSEGLSFSAWINFEGDSTARILSNYNGEAQGGNCNGRTGFVFGVTSDLRLNIFYAIDGNDYVGRWTHPNTISKNEWIHVLGTWNGEFSSSGFALFINGLRADAEDQSSGFFNCGSYLQSLNPFHIGMGHCARGECAPFDGSIDDVLIYNHPLSLNEIHKLAGR